MLLSDVLTSGAAPSLELSLRYAGQRQRLIAHNIANLTTPNFRHRDVSPAAFQKVLASAIDERRQRTGGMAGPLHWKPTQEVRQGVRGELHIVPRQTPGPASDRAGILAHDRNDRNLERLMQDHAENAAVFRISAELLRSRYSSIRDAIAQRV